MTASARPAKVRFSGFAREEKDELKKSAIDAGVIPVGAVSKSPGCLVCGPDCVPKVRVRAAELGIPVLGEDDFEAFLADLATMKGEEGERPTPLAIGQRLPMPLGTYVALDFETADRGWDSACAVAMVRIENGSVVSQAYSPIRPPREKVEFANIHGLNRDDLAGEKPFAETWSSLRHWRKCGPCWTDGSPISARTPARRNVIILKCLESMDKASPSAARRRACNLALTGKRRKRFSADVSGPEADERSFCRRSPRPR